MASLDTFRYFFHHASEKLMPLRRSESVAMDGVNHIHAFSPRLKISAEIWKPLKLPWTMLFSSCSVAPVAPFGTAVPLKGKLSRCMKWQS